MKPLDHFRPGLVQPGLNPTIIPVQTSFDQVQKLNEPSRIIRITEKNWRPIDADLFYHSTIVKNRLCSRDIHKYVRPFQMLLPTYSHACFKLACFLGNTSTRRQ